VPALATAVFALVVVAYVSWSVPLERWRVTAPIVFTLFGALLGWVAVDPQAAVVHDLAELTLALVLFHDAAQIRPRQLRPDAALCARLLLVGLPLTMALGFGMAWLLLPGVGVWLALLVGAALAPTDAGLGAATMLNPVVPVRIRRVLNVESGLNDGLATPVVLFAIAAAGGAEPGSRGTIGAAAAELVVGLVVGVVLGAGAGLLLSWAHRNGHIEVGLLPLAVLAIPLATYYGALGVHGNGFVGTFVAGTAAASGFTAREPTAPAGGAPAPLELTAWLSTILGFAVWALFGAVGVAHLGSTGTWRGLVYAALSLTVLRMLPVALSLLGSGLAQSTRWFIGWFGPRGLASVVFALIAVESLPASPQLAEVTGTLTATVLLSVVLHGITSAPWAEAYGRWVARTRPVEELGESVEPASTRGHLTRGRPSG
jgi:NhaP-type Na+/H+ or K+/H+ antiporter